MAQPTSATAHGAVPTIAQIAREVGVSVPTVSKVLNGRSDVAPATRARVEEALTRHRYRRRRQAAPTQGAGLVDLVFHRLGSTWSMEIIRGVEQAAAAARTSVILSELGGEHRPPRAWLETTLARPPVGVLLVASRLTPAQQSMLESRAIPFVVIDTDGEPPADVPTVGSDNWNGGLAATRHLLELGHRRIAAISGPADMLCSRARVDGYRSALAEAGVAFDPDLVRIGNFYVEAGYSEGLRLLSAPDRPTGIFAGSDMQALGVLRAALELGLRVPDDVSVVGYDDLPLAQWTGPALTTVRQPLSEMGAIATRMVLELAAGETPLMRRVNLATELVVRESTAPPPR
ncbi:LacI family DNA-binding transcriptional regulator [Isoptericola variabilis]|uniref:Transcriptional regulator, LacI family n=1 Tax=Isoptericola variabilis (strain 225) TaxID=743718 RepID=F6FU57_ISOV2|nr:LacI family DNA-binding transcriptional regulator [Isoptericola variabilis]AEG43253.1 transcriptional regulator, LacI family [Isoptericola variabilis 225]TWH35188.1 LacI family transcriptional regulator [Isoptericola variabilis J7]